MATLYFYSFSTTNWNTLSGWWQDSSFTIPATALPANGDTVYIESNVYTGPSTAITLAALYIGQIEEGVTLANSGSGISTTGDLTVGSNLTNYTELNSNLVVGGVVYGYFGGGIVSCTVTANSLFFYDNFNVVSSTFSPHSGSTLQAVFHDTANNYSSTIHGTASFYDSSVNEGLISGNADFHDSSINFNFGTVSGNASVYYPVGRPFGGTVTGTTTYFGYSLYFNSPAADDNWNNLANWYQDSAFTVSSPFFPDRGDTVYLEDNVTTGPTSAVILKALYIAQTSTDVALNDSGAGITITGDMIVGFGIFSYGTTSVSGTPFTVDGTAYFYGSGGGNSGTITVSQARFYLSTSNSGTVTGNAQFRDTSQNAGTISGNAMFNDLSSNASGGTVSGVATFNDSSFNADDVGGDGVFKNSTSNTGTVSGDASVYYPVSRPLGGTVTGSTTYINYP